MKLINIEPIIKKLEEDKSFTFCQDYDDGYDTGILASIIELEGVPKIEAKPIIYAHWILEREPDGTPYCYHCSHCDDDFHNIGIKCASDYCPNCGATMAKEIEDDKTY